MIFTKTYTKKQVRQILGVSASTLAHWLNNRYYEDLVRLGYKTTDKILSPKVLNWLYEKIDLCPHQQEGGAT